MTDYNTRSPDEAQRNPGSEQRLNHRSRISLRFIRATKMREGSDFPAFLAFCESFPASEMNSGLKTV
jgi:hypothetical protein